ncbi:MAG: hypothetical protein B7Y83_01955 [Flavobacteriales bacterium 32-34-25]|nr:MAG: hypothetical protein B7Y83_01955 [Flavobacteriales bacterium 32-34-25]
METELLGDYSKYIEEKFEDLTTRYNRFGKDLYREIQKELPEVFKKLKYYREKDGLRTFPDDSYAIFNDGKTEFRIILDPDCEVICLGNFETNIEIGNWNNDYYKEAIEFIKKEFLKIE